MKTMTCQDLAGACDVEFRAETFDEMAEMSKKHGMEMIGKGDQAHIDAMEKMKESMSDPEAMKEWFETVGKTFESLSEN
ncbi:MAG: DUF1059 domain-containing protein [Chloroflexi bacterium]|nr:DUF1059 domain-containing protein [Chloroflexota bacterium]MCI0800590.1 DUF1059 domain-containing protein [Chloroflexota bacterium]MCI0829504.1 DUF1059 domain-containing protein [Chloroflexota bacterium]MCI0848184.1 DUF1059 domain-containing protein [Chloroflexota bacterium]